MKTVNNRSKLGFFMNTGVTITVAMLLLFIPAVFYYANYIQWLFLAIACIIVLAPRQKKQPLQDTAEKISWLSWLGKIIVFEALSIGLFFCITAAINYWQPAMGHTQGLPFHFNVSHIIASFGIFPWVIIALLTIALRYHNDSNMLQTNPMDCCPKSLTRKDGNGAISAIINVTFQESSRLTLVISISCITLLLAAWLLGTAGRSIPINNVLTGFVFFVLFFFGLLNKKLKSSVFSLLNKKFPPLLLLSFFVACAASFVYLCATYLPGQMATTNDSDPTTRWLLRHGWQPYWNLLQYYWWIGMVAVAGPYFARISTGRSYRQIITGIAFLPVVIVIAVKLLQHHTHLLANFSSGQLPVGMASLLGIFCLFGMLSILFNKKNRPTLIFCSLPKRDLFKPRSPNQYVYMTIIYSLITMAFIVSTGIFVPAFYLIARNCILLISLTAIAINTLKITPPQEIKQSKRRLNNVKHTISSTFQSNPILAKKPYFMAIFYHRWYLHLSLVYQS